MIAREMAYVLSYASNIMNCISSSFLEKVFTKENISSIF